ncbi:MAG TPA: hypothetical protein VLJ39_15825 [Tepidisphaeraceae bacterium]|nr:hypothetical protein [Tepidisphaeraceae bacterium]
MMTLAPRQRPAYGWGDTTVPRPGFRARQEGVLAFLLGFLAFMPYPAIPAGNNTAVQLGSIISIVVAAPLLLQSWKRKPYYLYVLLLLPAAVSVLHAGFGQKTGLEVSAKALLTWALATITLLAGQRLLPRASLQVMSGIAVATIVHAVVGAWQFYVFRTGGELPLIGLYVNPSFLSVQENATTIAKWIQRPFGLFPEPSAMSSSLAPWILLWTAELFGLVKFAQRPSRSQRVLFGIASAAGLLLIISSRSGHAMVTLAVVFLFGVIWVKNARATARNFATILAVFGVLVPLVAWITLLAIGDRVREASGANQSWQDRSQSLLIGFKLWTSAGFTDLLFGLGLGLTANVMSGQYGLEAIWSVLLTYIYETGFLGALAVTWVGVYLARVWRATRFGVVFAGILFVWLVGVTVTTSYEQLLPIWLSLAYFTVWPGVRESSRQGRSILPTRVPADTSTPFHRGRLLTPSQSRDLLLTPWYGE